MEDGGVQIISRRMVKPEYQKSSLPPPEPETVHLTPWDLRRITVGYSQNGVLLPKPPTGMHAVEHLASSFARALGRFHPLAGRFAHAPRRMPDAGEGYPAGIHGQRLDKCVLQYKRQRLWVGQAGGRPGDKEDGLITVFEDGGGAGGMELEVCLAPDVLARLVADQELMSTSV
ncbi:hypothetical protein CFC21_027300 [Triticum aestivum]|uniref:Uncharacterized protein n=3 Tax=Triticinae TaxID=1648030 RepID=A0A9R1EN34_WHEAT|nr:hypothetical protein CFC21_027300 [Triticum aestivum]